MKVFLSTALALLLSPLAFADTPPPVVASIAPSAGPVAGGTAVVITGAHFDLPPGFACILPCPGTVAFGNVEVIPQQLSDTRIDVQTPPHSEGVVDVKIRTGDGRSVTLPYAFRYTAAGPEDGYEAILLPVYTDGSVAGANGSLWKSDFWLRNDGSDDITLAPWNCPADGGCGAVFPLTHVLKAGETLHNLPAFFIVPGPNPARLLYASRDHSRDLSGNLRTSDVSRLASNAGTEVPIVREADLHTATIQLHNVPLDAHFRIMLRIYEVSQAESRFRVNFYPEDTGASQPAIASVELTATASETGAFRLHPAWAQYGAITDLLNVPTILPVQLRAEIIPLTPGARFWAFISLTNNETQHVTLITPQWRR